MQYRVEAIHDNGTRMYGYPTAIEYGTSLQEAARSYFSRKPAVPAVNVTLINRAVRIERPAPDAAPINSAAGSGVVR